MGELLVLEPPSVFLAQGPSEIQAGGGEVGSAGESWVGLSSQPACFCRIQILISEASIFLPKLVFFPQSTCN